VGDEAGGRRPGAHMERAQRRVRVGVGVVVSLSGVAYQVQKLR
jgi:hypothetical protein